MATSIESSASRARGDGVAELVRREIVRGTFPPGFHLRESELANVLDVSRGPVREALARLEHEGLVVRRRHRGAVVVRLSRRDLDEVYDLRLMLDTLALKRADANATASDCAGMESALQNLATARSNDASVQIAAEVDLSFHDLIYEATRHGRLQRFWHELRTQVYIFLLSRKYVGTPEFQEVMVLGHQALLDAILSRNEAEAERVAGAHWRDPLRSVRSVRESYCPVSGKEDNRSDGTGETPAYAGADHQ